MLTRIELFEQVQQKQGAESLTIKEVSRQTVKSLLEVNRMCFFRSADHEDVVTTMVV